MISYLLGVLSGMALMILTEKWVMRDRRQA